MNPFFVCRRVLACLAVLLFSLTFAAAQQTAPPINAVAAFVRDNDEDAGLARKRVVMVKAAKDSDFGGEMTSERVLGFEQQVLVLINVKRASLGLAPLAWSESVARIARIHSINMATQNFFSHRGNDGKMVDGRADEVGVTKWRAIGENIAFNRGFKNPLETAVEKWLESPSHRENMLDARWQETGVGIAVTADGTFYFTQVFLKK